MFSHSSVQDSFCPDPCAVSLPELFKVNISELLKTRRSIRKPVEITIVKRSTGGIRGS